MTVLLDRPESADDVLDAVLFHHFNGVGCRPEYVERWHQESLRVGGTTTTKDERDALWPLLISFMVKERRR